MGKILTMAEAAERLGITGDELMTQRARALPPGILGFKKDGRLVWDADDLLEAPQKASEAAQGDDLTCPVCGFQAKTSGGLTTHSRRHDD